MTATRIGYARCSTDEQDLAAQRSAPFDLGVAEDRIYLDRGLTATTRTRPGLDPALAAVRAGAGRSGSCAPAPGSPAGCAYPPATPYFADVVPAHAYGRATQPTIGSIGEPRQRVLPSVLNAPRVVPMAPPETMTGHVLLRPEGYVRSEAGPAGLDRSARPVD